MIFNHKGLNMLKVNVESSDTDYLKALELTLDEWNSKNDDEDYGDL